jgi:hypothetical protein
MTNYDVLADGVVVGRIFKANTSPVGSPLFGEVEDVVDQREQVTARAEHAVEGLNVLF